MPTYFTDTIELLNFLDWAILITFLVVSLLSRFLAARVSRENTADFFLSGKNLPWWLLGISMVSAGFSCDTPNLITSLVRQRGISGNWVWWVFLITGMSTVFIYARLWKRSDTLNDLEFYEIRYSGKSAKVLRVFRSIYLGFFFNVLVMASLNLAAMKIGMIFLGLSPVKAVTYSSILIFCYFFVSGQKASIWSDILHFGIAITGAIYAAVVSLQYISTQHTGINNLAEFFTNPAFTDKISILPDFNDPAAFIPYLIIPFAVQWWTVWYSGAEPGGGGYVVEDLLRAKDEKNAIGATLFYSIIHYVIRPWPWIIVAFCSLLVFPTLESLNEAFPNIPDQFITHDIAYPAMISLLGHGWMGLIVATLVIAYISTIGIHLNIGVHYLVNDTYKKLSGKKLSLKRHRIASIVVVLSLIVCSALVALSLTGAYQAFELLLLIGAGTGPVYLLRWFWWRITPTTEMSAMVSSIVVACVLLYFEGPIFERIDIPANYIFSAKLLIATAITTAVWIFATYQSKPSSILVLRNFYILTRPGGIGWKHIVENARMKQIDLENGDIVPSSLPIQLLSVLVGMIMIYCLLFAIGYAIYGHWNISLGLSMLASICIYIIYKLSDKVKLL